MRLESFEIQRALLRFSKCLQTRAELTKRRDTDDEFLPLSNSEERSEANLIGQMEQRNILEKIDCVILLCINMSPSGSCAVCVAILRIHNLSSGALCYLLDEHAMLFE